MLNSQMTLEIVRPVAPTRTELEMAQAEIARLQQLNRSLRILMGHELGSPLAVVVAYLRLWQEQGVKFAREELNLVADQALLLKARLEDLVLLDQLEAGRGQLVRERVQVYPLLQRAARKYSALLQAKQLSVRFDLQCQKPVRLDTELMTRALEHLLSNAIKFSPDGGAIVLGTTCAEDCFTVTVQDQGIGIGERDLDLIFDSAYLPELNLARRYGGLGVGLKLVRAIMQRHGGALRVTSQPGKATRFSLELPSGG